MSHRAEMVSCHALDRQPKSPANDGSDVGNLVPFIIDCMPHRAGGCRLQRQSEQDRGVECMNRRPALRAVTGVAGNA